MKKFLFKIIPFLLVALCPLALFAGVGHHGSHHANHISGPADLSKATVTTSTFDHQGRLWLAWVFGKDLYVNYSDDKGKTFSVPVQVDGEDEVVSSNAEARPNISVTQDGIVYVSYAEKLKKRFSGHVRFSRSTNNGKSFSAPIIVNDDQQMIGHSFGTLTTNERGDVYMTWLDSRERVAAKAAGETYTGSAVFYARSTNKGLSFEPNVKVADNSCQCCRIAATLDESGLPVIVWRHIYGKDVRDHAMVRFTSETAFTAPYQVSDDDWRIESCPHHGPSLKVDQQGRYHMTWFTNGSKRQGVFYAYSDDQGKTFSKPLAIGSPEEPAKHAYLLEKNGKIYITWKAFDGESTTLNIMYSKDRGERWAQSFVVATTQGKSDHPFILDNRDEVYLSWQTANEGFQLLSLPVQKPVIKGLVRGSYKKIIESRSKPFVVNLWSIDCPPCRKELVMLRELSLANPELDVVLISTDEPEYREEVLEVIGELGLSGMELWHFDDAYVERLRFEIDRAWFGELPRSYFYSLSDEIEAVSGVVSKEKMISWMQKKLSN